jgi:hypothetical protein
MIKAVLSFFACVLFIGGYWISNSVAGDNNELYQVWRMNLIAINFLFLCICIIIKTKQHTTIGAFTDWFMLTHLLFCIYDVFDRSFRIYHFRKFDVYALMFIPIISAGLYVAINHTKIREIFRK